MAEPAADPADHQRDRCGVRAAVPARPASGLRRREDSRVRDDPFLDLDPAWLLRRLHFLFDHRTRRPHHPESLRRLGDPRDRDDPRYRARLHRRDFGPRRTHGQYVPRRVQIACDRSRVPQAVVRLPGHLPEPQHGPLAADRAVPACTGAEGREEGADRIGRTVRPRDRITRVREGAGATPRGRLPQDRARSARGRPALEDDEAGCRHLRSLQGTLRQILEGSGQGAVPDSVLHRGAPGYARRRHARTGTLAQAQRLPRRPGAGIPALADGDGHRDVPLRQESAAQSDAHLGGCRHPEGHAPAPPAQGVPALSRSEQLAAVARSAAADGALRPDRQWPEPAGADVPADRHRPCPRRSAQAREVFGITDEITAEDGGEGHDCTAVPDPAHGIASCADRDATAPNGSKAQAGPVIQPGAPAG